MPQNSPRPARSRVSRVSLAALACASLGVSGLAQAAPAAAAAAPAVVSGRVVAAADPAGGTSGQVGSPAVGSFTFAVSDPAPGELVTAYGQMATNAPRTLFLQFFDGARWRSMSRGRVDKKGAFKVVAFTPRKTEPVRYRVYGPEQTINKVRVASIVLPEQTVTPVIPTLTYSTLPTTIPLGATGQAASITADLDIVHPNRVISLQMSKGRSWKTVSSFKFKPVKTGAVGADGKPIMVLPSEATLVFPTKADLTAIFRINANAYLGSRPIISPLFKVKIGAGTASVEDNDADGLSNATEAQIGTDPNNPDTDGDGIPDGVENTPVSKDGLGTGTDPKKADSDGDGISDGDEIELGTDPTKADTDGDGISDSEEIARGLNPKAKDVDTDGDGLTDSEEKALGTNPKAADTDGDGRSDYQEVVVDKTDPTLAPGAADTDGDGLSDVYETGTSLTDPNLVDTDMDGLSDGDEVNNTGTNPLVADADGDGLDDGYEVNVATTDPKVADTDGDGLADGAEVNTYGSNPKNTDTDADTLGDKVEVDGTANVAFANAATDPVKADTDADGIGDPVEIAGTRNTGYGNAPTNPAAADSDTDGLPDGIEVPAAAAAGFQRSQAAGKAGRFEVAAASAPTGTNPNNADTDADTLLDGVEVDTLGTNPKSDDTDADTLGDAAEVNTYTTNPTLADTDSDGLGDAAEAGPDSSGPLGVDLDPKQAYSWAVPSNKVGVASSAAYLVKDAAYLAGTDTDGEGLADYREVIEGTSKTVADTDGEGVNDFAEVVTYTTNPKNADTDADGLTDNIEVGTTLIKAGGTTGAGGIDLDPKAAYSWAAPSNKVAAATTAVVNDKAYYDNLDTDAEGLKDYLEVGYGTDKTKADTDTDGANDNVEAGPGLVGPDNIDLDPLAAYSWAVPSNKVAAATTAVVKDGAYVAGTDTDGEGLKDYREVIAGTSKTVADTDGDTLTDNQEVTGSANTGFGNAPTDPLLADTDGDQSSDGKEILVHGSNPNNAASFGQRWSQIDQKGSNGCGIRFGGLLYCWGDNSDSNLGANGATATASKKYKVGGNAATAKWSSVAVGNHNACGIQTDSTLWCWGRNAHGQAGVGTTGNLNTPTQVSGGGTWKSISTAPYETTCGVKTDGTLWCWGVSDEGHLGIGPSASGDYLTPQQVGTETNWTKVSLAPRMGCALQSDGDLYCWGYAGANGRNFGINASPNAVFKSPVRVGAAGEWGTSMSAAGSHVCATKANGSLWCWGEATSGALGNNTTTASGVPVAVSGGFTWASAGE